MERPFGWPMARVPSAPTAGAVAKQSHGEYEVCDVEIKSIKSSVELQSGHQWCDFRVCDFEKYNSISGPGDHNDSQMYS